MLFIHFLSHPPPLTPHPHPSPLTPHPSAPTPHPTPLIPHPSPPTPYPSPLTPHPLPLTPHPRNRPAVLKYIKEYKMKCEFSAVDFEAMASGFRGFVGRHSPRHNPTPVKEGCLMTVLQG